MVTSCCGNISQKFLYFLSPRLAVPGQDLKCFYSHCQQYPKLLFHSPPIIKTYYFPAQLVENVSISSISTAQKMKFSIKDFFSKCDQIRSFLWIWSHLLKKFLMENFIFCPVIIKICSLHKLDLILNNAYLSCIFKNISKRWNEAEKVNTFFKKRNY